MKTALEWKKYYSTSDFKENYIYEGDDLGVQCTPEGTAFRLWSPSALSVTLNLYRDGEGGEAFRFIPMEKRKKGVWGWETEQEL
ncbi:MAG TPA: type I pullulanase, partial [Candidatus Mediterraneibacter norfolkensis]|nr:type I pullulanase [Candidatus Mediterraneibacter norfolkensis]